MVNYSWLGPYENIREEPEKFAKYCKFQSKANEKIIKEAGKPEKVVLWNFISNIRDTIIIVDHNKPPSMGYDNYEFMTLFQKNIQNIWKIFEPKFNEIIPIVPISDAINAGLYNRNCLREQFPSSSIGNAPGYKTGSFDTRQIGGWKWFGLILDEENWSNEWDLEKIPEKLSIRVESLENTAPKYYKSYIYSKGKWSENKKGEAYYGKPAGCNTIPRRYSIPVIASTKPSDESYQRYQKFIKIILKDLETQWTLSVWNIISFDYKVLENNVKLEIRPEISIDLGWIKKESIHVKELEKLDEKQDILKHIYDLRHFKEVFTVRVGLPNKYKLSLPLYIKNKLNPIWDGTAEGILGILFEPYSKLIDLAIQKLKDLMAS